MSHPPERAVRRQRGQPSTGSNVQSNKVLQLFPDSARSPPLLEERRRQTLWRSGAAAHEPTG
jgi:hypothetical protein